MAHVFKWKAIYRIIKNQRSPQIEERGIAFSVEYAALLGSCAWCLTYLIRTNVGRAMEMLAGRSVRSLVNNIARVMIDFILAYAFLIEAELLDRLGSVAGASSGSAAAGGAAAGAELTGAGEIVGGEIIGSIGR